MSQTEYFIEKLSNSEAYPHEVDRIEIEQTHISIVFLAGPSVYKIKKSIELPFLDYSTLEKRKHFCQREVSLNRRLSPESIYRGTVPITRDGEQLKVDGDGKIIEWAVEMKRLPKSRNFEAMLQRGELRPELIEKAARIIADFHHRASVPDSKWGDYDHVRDNMLDNFEETTDHIGQTICRKLHQRLRKWTENRLEESRRLIEKRARDDTICDGHGDLRLKHLYYLPTQVDSDIAVVDCIEFNDRFRYGDPISDIAFLNMDLHYEKADDLRDRFVETYFDVAEDKPQPKLLELYTAYRALVRAKVEGISLVEKKLNDEERTEVRRESLAHWLLAARLLAPPDERPFMMLLGGLPGTGKSTIADSVGGEINATIIDSDRVRKRLVDSDTEGEVPDYGEGIYTEEWTRRTYRRCLELTRRKLEQGQRVIIEASFKDNERRRIFWELADQLSIDAFFVECIADDNEIRNRLKTRNGGPSDADWDIYRKMKDSWDGLEYWPEKYRFRLDTNQPLASTCSELKQFLSKNSLLSREESL